MLDNARTDLSGDGLVYHPRSLMRAEMHRALGENRSARIHYEKAIATMKDSSAARPLRNDPRFDQLLERFTVK